MKKIIGAFIALAAFLSAPATAEEGQTPSVEGAKVYIISPKDGDVIRGAVIVKFGLKGMGVAPAGVEKAGTGHHHLIIDAPLPALDDFIPADEHHKHFGGSQTEVELKLAPGKHTLQLLLGDDSHLPHYPAVTSRKITITVKE